MEVGNAMSCPEYNSAMEILDKDNEFPVVVRIVV